MGYIESGKEEGATLHHGGARVGTEGYFIQPTIFTDVKPHMKIVKEEIFGPVGVVIKFKDEDDVLRQANDTVYGLAAAVFTKDLNKAIRTANRLKAGTVWVNCVNHLHAAVPFGGYKQSGIGRELGEYALAKYVDLSVFCAALIRDPSAATHMSRPSRSTSACSCERVRAEASGGLAVFIGVFILSQCWSCSLLSSRAHLYIYPIVSIHHLHLDDIFFVFVNLNFVRI